VVLVPEQEIDIDHVCALLKHNYDNGKHYGVGWWPRAPSAGGWPGDRRGREAGLIRARALSGIGEALAELIEKKTGYETRSVNLATRSAAACQRLTTGCWAALRTACDRHGARGQVGRIAVLNGLDITDITIKERLRRTGSWIRVSSM